MLSSVREAQKASKKRAVSKRPRRQVGSEAAAMQIAEGLVTEISAKYPELSETAATGGTIPPELEKALEKGMEHYRERVISRFRPLFHDAVNRIILKRDEGRTPSDDK